ncbi:MAG: geranylgeranylglycerol-phosphate geranylgeranyltransferase [Reichenbachiella sp.]
MSIPHFIELFKQALKLSRIQNLVIIAATQYFAAIFLVHGIHQFEVVLLDVRFFGLVLSTVIIAASGYFINDYYDVKIDLINKPDKVIVGKSVKRRPVLLGNLVLNGIGVLMGAWVSIWVGVVNFVCAFLLWLYSNQLKKMPFIGNLLVALMTSAALLIIALYYRSNELLLFTYALFAFGITIIREIIKDIEDRKGDESFGGKTLPIAIGVRNTKMVLYFFILIFVIAISAFLIKVNNIILINYFALMAIPMLYFVILLIKADTKSAFSNLSRYCKWLIVAGIFSMVLISY